MVGQDSMRNECISHGHLGYDFQIGAIAGEGGLLPPLEEVCLMQRFQEFYKEYPRKVARKDAEKAWARLTPEEKARAIEALPLHIRYWEQSATAKEYIPHPATWLNGGRYDDEIEMPAIPTKAVAWWASEEGVMSKGRELGIHARGGESMNEFKARVVEAARRAA